MTRIISILATLAILLSAVNGCQEDKTKAIQASKISYDLGVNYLNSSQPRQALESFEKAVRENPEFPDAHNAVGLMYFSIRDFGKAEEHFLAAIELKPDYSDAFNNLGRLYLERGQYDKAIEMFRKALSNLLYQTPQFASANLGWAYYKKGMMREAFEQLNKAVSMDPKFCLGYRLIGVIRMENGDGLEAKRAFEKFRDTCPKEADAYYRLAEVKQKLKLAPTDEVLSDLEHSLDLNQNYCPARLMLSGMLSDQGKDGEALESIDRYFNACQEEAGPDAYVLMGTLFRKLGQTVKADAYFESCARKWSGKPDGQKCRDLVGKK
ncbi:MAG: tetratricopeptide repeat protein [Myxococcota bacterium]|jgi:type IV pilus biogenesis/stability protein PilW